MVCDQSTAGGGWTVVVFRDHVDGVARVDFDLPWQEYKDGFGNVSLQGEHWLGLDTLHQITQQASVA